jgi:hypothetical protein
MKRPNTTTIAALVAFTIFIVLAVWSSLSGDDATATRPESSRTLVQPADQSPLAVWPMSDSRAIAGQRKAVECTLVFLSGGPGWREKLRSIGVTEQLQKLANAAPFEPPPVEITIIDGVSVRTMSPLAVEYTVPVNIGFVGVTLISRADEWLCDQVTLEGDG